MSTISLSRDQKEELLISIREKFGNDAVSYNNLDHPTSEFMMNYSIRVLTELGVNIQEMLNKHSVDHFDAFRDTFPYFVVYNAIIQLFPMKNYLKNFSVMCLMDPKPNDVYFVMLMDNFHDFNYQRMGLMEPARRRLEEGHVQVEQLRKKKEQLQRSLNDQAAQRSRRDAAITKCEARLREIALEEAALDKELSVEEERLCHSEQQCQGLMAENTALEHQLQLIHDAAKRDATYLSLGEKRDVLRFRSETQEQQLVESAEALKSKTNAVKLLERRVALEKDVAEATRTLVDTAHTLEAANKKLHHLELQQKKEALKWQETQRQLKEDHEEREAAATKLQALEARRKSLQHEVGVLRRELDDKKQQLGQLDQDRTVAMAEAEDARQTLSSLHVTGVEERQEFEHKYAEIGNQLVLTIEKFSNVLRKDLSEETK